MVFIGLGTDSLEGVSLCTSSDLVAVNGWFMVPLSAFHLIVLSWGNVIVRSALSMSFRELSAARNIGIYTHAQPQAFFWWGNYG